MGRSMTSPTNKATGRFRLKVLLVALPLAGAGCGYALAGRGSFLPAYIQTIGVPIFVNNTPVFDAEQVLTSRVRQELIARGKYKVLPEAGGADAVLHGEIASITLTPSGFDADQQATRYTAQVVMRVTFRDVKANKILLENPALVFREEFEVVSNAGTVLDPNAFFGQGGNALDRMATEFARTVVSSLLEGF
jgi:hypothetical protein